MNDEQRDYALVPLWAGYVKNKRIVGYAKVSCEDFQSISQYEWGLLSGYPYRRGKKVCGGGTMMHQIIMPTEDGLIIDHINHDPKDNRRINLRRCTRRENNVNRRIKSPNEYRGITKIGKYYYANVNYDSTNFRLKRRDCIFLAALDFDWASRYFNGQFAFLNFPNLSFYTPDDVDIEYLETMINRPSLSNGRRNQPSELGFRGVSRSGGKFRAGIYFNEHRKHLGTFSTAEEAARAVDAFELEHYGDRAVLNFPLQASD